MSWDMGAGGSMGILGTVKMVSFARSVLGRGLSQSLSKLVCHYVNVIFSEGRSIGGTALGKMEGSGSEKKSEEEKNLHSRLRNDEERALAKIAFYK